MKYIKIAVLTILLIIGFNNVNAQDANNPWEVGFGVNSVDFYPTNSGLLGHGAWFDEFFNMSDHYNTPSSISKLSVARYLTDGFSFEVAGTLNQISKVGDNSISGEAYFGLDGAVQYDLNNVVGESSWFNPYASVGGGYVWMGKLGASTFNGGLGINVWFSDHFGLNLETKYKHTFASNIVQHFQHSIGVVVKLGGTDTDGDGVYDKFDACPEVFGLAEYQGCPDSDSDGIIDSKDDCPNIAGLATLNGCPDTDGDGIADKDDACPNAKGTKANKGCPDTDGDGVLDKNDTCPNVVGPAENKGCPWPDTDGDGVLDKDDNCVDKAGPASNNGCPEITPTEVAKLEELFKTVNFETGKEIFTEETPSKLTIAAQIMMEYSTANFSILGHADSTGSKKSNQDLSERRADKVKNFLESKGVSPSNLTSEGFGEDMPIASNNTRLGKAKNRRVEVKLVD